MMKREAHPTGLHPGHPVLPSAHPFSGLPSSSLRAQLKCLFLQEAFLDSSDRFGKVGGVVHSFDSCPFLQHSR